MSSAEQVESSPITSPGVSKWRRPLVGVSIAAVVVSLGAYFPVLSAPFFSDDLPYVVHNAPLHRASLSQPLTFFRTRTNPYEFAPIRDISYKIDLELFGLAPTGFRAHNLLLYLLTCLALWLFFRQLFEHINAGRAADRKLDVVAHSAVGVAIFAAHPAHVESVAWISGRKDVLSGLLSVLFLWLLLAATKQRIRWGVLACAVICLAAALLSKSAVLPVTAVAILLLVRNPLGARRGLPRAIAIGILLAAITVAAIWLATSVGKDTGIRLQFARSHGAWARFRDAAAILGYLTRISLAPVNLRLIYDVAAPGALFVTAVALAAAATLAAIWGAWAFLRRSSPTGLGIVCFFLLCLPFLQLIPFSSFSLASERFLFLALVGFALAVSVLLMKLPPRWRLGVTALLLTGWLASTVFHAQVWQSRDRLLTRSARFAPQDAAAQNRYVRLILLPRGRFSEAATATAGIRNGWARAILSKEVQLNRALAADRKPEAARLIAWHRRILGRHGELIAHLALGRAAERRSKWKKAIRHYYRAWTRRGSAQGALEAKFGLQRVRARFAGELRTRQKACTKQLKNLRRCTELGNLYMTLFHLPEAAQIYRGLIARHSQHPILLYNLGLTYLRMERYRMAASAIQAAVDKGFRAPFVLKNLRRARAGAGK